MRCLLLLMIVLALLLLVGMPVTAVPPAQEGDPVAQCAKGVQLFHDGRASEALLLLEAGFAAREQVVFANLDELGRCALALGGLRYDTGDRGGALEAYKIALGAFQTSGNRLFEGITLNNAGGVHESQGHYTDALKVYQQALAILREVGNQVGESTTLNNIGGVYYDQGRYGEALEALQQSLAIARDIGDRTGEGITLNNVGKVYSSQGRNAEALEVYQQALAILREMSDQAGELSTLSNISEVYYHQGRYMEALELWQQALAVAREAGDRAGEGNMLNSIGSVYYAQGRYAEALEIWQQALVIRRELDDRTGEGDTLTGIGEVYVSQGRYAEALGVFQQALVIRREVGDRHGEGTTLHDIGVAYYDQGRYGEALDFLQQALAIAREVGDRHGEGNSLTGIGGVHASQGRYAEALEVLQQALAIEREVGDRAGEGYALAGIGPVYYAQGRYAEALEIWQQALVMLREVGDRAGEGAMLNNIGGMYYHQGRYPEALKAYQQALAIRREVGDRAGEGTTNNNIGLVYSGQGRYTEALEYYQQALAIAREVDDRASEGTTVNNIGGVYYDQGRYGEALEVLQQALAIAREVGDQVGEGATLHSIGSAYQRQGESDQALAYYEQAMEVFESVRAVAGSEAGRAGFIAQHAGLYDRAVGLCHEQSQDAEALHTSERARARAFLDSMATGYVELSDNAIADLLAREQETYAVRQTAQDALVRARAQQPLDPQLVTDLETQLSQVEEEYATALAAIEARGDQLAALVPGRSRVLDLPQVQALLDEQTTLVSFWILENQTLTFVIARDSFHTVALDVSWEDLITQISDFRSFPNLEIAYPPSAMTLYAELIAPLKEYLTTPHLAIVPHGVLHYLPFAALTDGQRYLLDDYVITYLPSASVLPFIQENTGHTGGLPLILGNPAIADFDTTASLATERDSLGPLPFAEQEAKAIAVLYGTEARTGTAATESVVRERAGEVNLLHLAAHGRYNPIAPLSSLVALAPDKTNDGWLTVAEIYGLGLRKADLAVLSACETQVGKLSAGDEVVGLTRAFFFAGTPTVIASLWSVDDRSTGLLMERFYTHLRAGMGKAEALRQAQLEVRTEYPNPYYWSAFVLSGDSGALGAPKRPEQGTVLATSVGIGIAVLLILLAAVWFWYKRHKGERSVSLEK